MAGQAARAGAFARAGPEPGADRVFFRSRALLWTIASLLAFVAVESAIFRAGWYNKYLEPDSSAGAVEFNLFWLRHAPPANVPEIAVVGDSRIGEGFSALKANTAAGNRVRFWNAGIPGTMPRTWYYFLRDADPTRHRFRAIVFAMDQYSDEDSFDSKEDRIRDLNLTIGRLGLTDCWPFAESMHNAQSERTALTGCIFRGLTLRRDVQEFLPDIGRRIRRTRLWRNNGAEFVSAYRGHAENLNGLSADFVKRTINFPAGLDEARRNTIQDMVMPLPAPQTGEMTRYRRRWLGAVLELYRNSATHLIFLELPRAPLPKPESSQPARFLSWAVEQHGVTALPPETFRDLEQPEYFFDGLHLNSLGRGIFSTRVSELLPVLAGIAPAAD